MDIEPLIESIALYWKNRPGKVTGALQALQDQAGYLDEESVQRLALALEIPLSRLYGTATFFSAFRLKPRGQYHVQVCEGTACHVRGARHLMEGLERMLKVASGDTTPDGRFSLEPVRCLGCCGLAPVVVVNDVAHGRLKQTRLEHLFQSEGARDEGTDSE